MLRAVILVALFPTAALAQQPGQDVDPKVVNGVEYRLKYGTQPDQGWQDGMRFDFSRDECRQRLAAIPAPAPATCMIRPATTEL
jgi:hypothetical protein